MEYYYDRFMKPVSYYRPYVNHEEGNKTIIPYNSEMGPYYGIYESKFEPCVTRNPYINYMNLVYLH